MADDADKIVAATLAAAMLRRLEPTGSLQEDAKNRDNYIRFAERLYRDMLATLQAETTEGAGSMAASPTTPDGAI